MRNRISTPRLILDIVDFTYRLSTSVCTIPMRGELRPRWTPLRTRPARFFSTSLNKSLTEGASVQVRRSSRLGIGLVQPLSRLSAPIYVRESDGRICEIYYVHHFSYLLSHLLKERQQARMSYPTERLNLVNIRFRVFSKKNRAKIIRMLRKLPGGKKRDALSIRRTRGTCLTQMFPMLYDSYLYRFFHNVSFIPPV